jgi:hypothetical protein
MTAGSATPAAGDNDSATQGAESTLAMLSTAQQARQISELE